MQGVTRREDRSRYAVLFGAALRHAREAKAMSQERLASAAELSQPYLSPLERGENSPTIDVVFRLCDALNVTPAELLGEVWRDRR
jgi:transcriptional regulator with XRE-family HTH domain